MRIAVAFAAPLMAALSMIRRISVRPRPCTASCRGCLYIDFGCQNSAAHHSRNLKPRADLERLDRVFQKFGRHSGIQQRAQKHVRSEEHTSELQSPCNLVCRLLLDKKTKRIHEILFQSPSLLPGALRADGLIVIILNIPVKQGVFFFFNDTATTEIYTLSLHDALPI